MMFSLAKFATFIFGLATVAVAVPAPASTKQFDTDGGFIVTHNAVDYFPHATGDLSPWDIAVRFTGYNSTMEEWLTSLDPSFGANDEEKAKILVSAAYVKPFDKNDPDMVGEVEALLGAVAGETTEDVAKRIEKRNTQYIVSLSHVVVWHACEAFFSCVSGATCSFSIDVGKAPRSQCQSQGGQNCCISWSTYKVQAGFFSRTWTNCDVDVQNSGHSSASCEGKSDSTGGDVCLSNRASGCT
ncbi:hypothetical protein B0T10DRAFT_492169 [Thelonectria olida]|uniref:WD-like domain-containing protein n=1 Tax=Thelonectria olida TaxID=1576542 RepID=A0A9P9APU5_9HYPO|nr:hypothetical protein B0T10DRAFT_492169 [Thelonectria olida]